VTWRYGDGGNRIFGTSLRGGGKRRGSSKTQNAALVVSRLECIMAIDAGDKTNNGDGR